MARKVRPTSDLSTSAMVKQFLALPAVGQQVMLSGLRHEQSFGDRASAEELLNVLLANAQAWTVIDSLEHQPVPLTPGEEQQLVTTLDLARPPKLPKSKAHRRG